MTKRFVPLLLALVLCAALFPARVSAAFESQLDYSALDTPYEEYQKLQGQGITINVYNWGEYISDGSDGSMDANGEFEALTGVHVNYLLFASNEELYAKMKSGGSSYDIVIPSDYMISRLAGEELLLPLDFGNIPNYANVDAQYKGLEYDPDETYSVPYTWGVVGIVYNTKLVDPADDMATWDVLWNEKYLGDILMFSNSRDAFGIALKSLGYSLNSNDPDELREAAELLQEQKPLVQAYVMDEIYDKMGGGEAAIAPYYAGDSMVMMEDNPDLAFAIPVEGTNHFVDAMCVPSTSKNKEAAEMYINFMCETQVGAATFDFIGYSTPLATVYDGLDEETLANPVQFPPEEDMARTEVFMNLPTETNVLMDALWTEVLSTGTGENKWFIPFFIVGALALTVVIDVVRKRRRKRNNY